MRNLYVLLLGAMGFWLGNANPVWHLPLLCLLFPVCLAHLGHEAASPLHALRLGWVCAMLGSAAALYWLAVPVHLFGGLPLALAIPCSVAVGAYVGLYDGLFALLAYLVREESPGRRALMLGLGWLLLDWLRGWLFTGFPWLGLATAFAPWTFAIQGVSVLGSYGFGGLLAGLSCLLAAGLYEKNEDGKKSHRRLAVAALCGFALLAGFGSWRLLAEPLTAGEPVPVALVQGNVEQNVKWDPAMQRATLAKYLELSADALHVAPKPSLLVWPETAMPFDYARHETLSPLVRQFAATNQVSVLFGTVGREPKDSRSWRITNRAHLAGPAGDAGWYEKEHLVPFGEYAPAWLDFDFLAFLLQGVGNFTPGRRTGPLEASLANNREAGPVSAGTTEMTSAAPPAGTPYPGEGSNDTLPTSPPAVGALSGRLVLGVLICYETVFPELARARVAAGAEALINISNDAWFGRTVAPRQHLYLTLLRAVEQGRPLARATNTGISAYVDPYGRLSSTSELFVEALVPGEIRPVRDTTLFFHLEPWLAPAAAFFLALLGFGTLRRRNLSANPNR